MSLTCPYCKLAMASPPPRDAGRTFGCPFCAKLYRFTGIAAMAIPQPAIMTPSAANPQPFAASPSSPRPVASPVAPILAPQIDPSLETIKLLREQLEAQKEAMKRSEKRWKEMGWLIAIIMLCLSLGVWQAPR